MIHFISGVNQLLYKRLLDSHLNDLVLAYKLAKSPICTWVNEKLIFTDKPLQNFSKKFIFSNKLFLKICGESQVKFAKLVK